MPVCPPQVLHCCVCGSSTYTQQSHYTLTLADLSSTDYDPFLPLANVRNSEPVQYHASADLGNLLTVEEGKYDYRYTISCAGKGKIVVLSVLGFVLNPLLNYQFIGSLIAPHCLPCFFLLFFSCYFSSSLFSHLKLYTWFVLLKTCLFHTHEMHQKACFLSPSSFPACGGNRTLLGS